MLFDDHLFSVHDVETFDSWLAREAATVEGVDAVGCDGGVGAEGADGRRYAVAVPLHNIGLAGLYLREVIGKVERQRTRLVVVVAAAESLHHGTVEHRAAELQVERQTQRVPRAVLVQGVVAVVSCGVCGDECRIVAVGVEYETRIVKRGTIGGTTECLVESIRKG